MARLDSEQKSIVRAILQESRKIQDPVARRKFRRAAVETGLVESNLRNLNYGDADSQGWRQERTSIYGTGRNGPMNVRASIARFRQEFLQQYDPGERAGEVAAQVQRPAAQFRGRYQERAKDAREILAQFGGAGGGSSSYRSPAVTVEIPGVDNSATRRAALQQYVLDRGKPDSLLTLGLSLRGTRDSPGYSLDVPRFNLSGGDTRGDGFTGKVTEAPGADRPGVPTSRKILRFLKEVSDRAGSPIEIGTGSNHSKYTVSGNISDHYVGRGADVPASGSQLVRLGRKALIAAGMPRSQARKVKGGLFNVNGYQIIFNTQEGGDHTDHLHVGYSPNR